MTTLDPSALVTVPRKPTWQQLEQAAHNLSDGFGAEFVIANEAFAMAVYDEMLAAAPSALSQPQAGEPTGYIDKHRQKFANIEMHDAETLAKGGWTPVYLASPQPALAVKGLEWSEHPNAFPAPAWSAHTGFGFYHIEVSASDSPAYEVRLHAHHLISVKDDLEAAKAAAQADYETRIRSALVASPPPSGEVEDDGSMTAEETRLEDLKQMAAYSGPIVSFDVTEPYYLASCDHCGWVGSSERCGTDSFGDDSDVYCPRCHASGADCGKIAAALSSAPATADGWRTMEDAPKDGQEFIACLPRQGGVRILVRWGKVHNTWITKGEPVSLFDGDLWQPLPAAPTGGR